MSTLERFSAFYVAANGGSRPYPWQCALVERVAATGRWPDIAAPTGAGKTAVVDVHVFLVAEHAAGARIARPPRRLILVAPRRVLVDDQYERALRLARLLHEADLHDSEGESMLAGVARALRTLALAEVGDGQPAVGVWRLRGGVAPETGWRLEPAACQIICSTPQMWGSRMLMRGYLSTRAARNLESGLLAHDAVAVIDEAHLHERLLETARRVAAFDRGPLPLQVAGMSATGRRADGQVELTEADRRDPGLSMRIGARKRLVTVEIADLGARDATIAALVDTARAAAGAGTVGVFANDVSTAISVSAALRAGGATVELVCGRMRQADLERLRIRRPGLLTIAGDADVDYLVATQSLEVGVDLDLPALVTVVASPAALAQRAGRLNRTGRHADAVLSVVTQSALSELDPERDEDLARVRASGPYTPAELIAGARWLAELAGSISPEAVMAHGLPPRPRPLLPAIREADLLTLALTSQPIFAEPDPDLYIEDPGERADEVYVAARKHLDCEPEVVREMLLACPPRDYELATLRRSSPDLRWLLQTCADRVWVLRAQHGAAERNDGLDAFAVCDPAFQPEAGDTLVVPAGEPVCVAGVVGKPRAGRAEPLDDVLAFSPAVAGDAVLRLRSENVCELVERDADLASRAARNDLADLLVTLAADSGDGSADAKALHELAHRLRTHRRLADLRLVWCGGADAASGLLVVLDMVGRAPLAWDTEPSAPVSIDSHQAAVGERMRAILHALGHDLDASWVRSLQRAAELHDEGKRHPKFQARMGSDPDQPPLAKPKPGHRADRGDGWRHEQLSAVYALASGEDARTVALIATHHGHGRGLFDRRAEDLLAGWDGCGDEVAAAARALYGARGCYERLRERVQREHGVLGLAWFEALVRCADMQVSKEER